MSPSLSRSRGSIEFHHPVYISNPLSLVMSLSVPFMFLYNFIEPHSQAKAISSIPSLSRSNVVTSLASFNNLSESCEYFSNCPLPLFIIIYDSSEEG